MVARKSLSILPIKDLGLRRKRSFNQEGRIPSSSTFIGGNFDGIFFSVLRKCNNYNDLRNYLIPATSTIFPFDTIHCRSENGLLHDIYGSSVEQQHCAPDN